MQKFFVASLFLMFGCYGGEEHQEIRKAKPPLVRPKAKRPEGSKGPLASKSTMNLWGNLSPEEIATIQAQAAAAEEKAKTAQKLKMAANRIVEADPRCWGLNCGGKGTFTRTQLQTETAKEKQA